MQFKNDGSGDQRPIDLKIRIFCGGADKNHRPVFHKGKQIILLSFIKPMDLINKQNGFSGIHASIFFCLPDNFFHVFLSGRGGVDLKEFRLCGSRDHFRQRRLSRPRRAKQEDGTEFIRLDGPVEQLVLPDNVLLPHHFIQCPGTKSGSKGGFLFFIFFIHVFQ